MNAPEVCILGIDPGASGAIAFYFPSRPALIAVEDVPLAAGAIDAATLARRIGQMAPTIALIEQVHAMPKQGVSSTFKFGVSYGIVQASSHRSRSRRTSSRPAGGRSIFACPQTRKRLGRWRCGSGPARNTSAGRRTTAEPRPR